MTLPNPQCDCCGPPTCEITTTDTLTDYTQVSGTWTKPAASIETTDATALIYFNTPHPDGLSIGKVAFTISVSATATYRLLLAYQDANNYIFMEMEVKAGDDIAKLGHRTGGVDTFLEEVHGTSTSTADLCYNGSRITSKTGISGFTSGTLPTAASGADSPLTGNWGTFVGVEVLANTGTVSFNGLTFHGYNDVSCAVCQTACYGCGLTGTPGEYSLYMTGVANAACATCTTGYNGATFILQNTVAATASRNCYFRKDTVPCLLINDFIDFKLADASANQDVAELRIGSDGFFAFTRTADDCSEVLTVTNGGSGVRCDWTGATAELTPNMA